MLVSCFILKNQPNTMRKPLRKFLINNRRFRGIRIFFGLKKGTLAFTTLEGTLFGPRSTRGERGPY